MTKQIYIAVNKNGDVRMFTDEPVRNTDTGRWDSANPFVNSQLYKGFVDLCQKSHLTWECEPEPFTLEFPTEDTKNK